MKNDYIIMSKTKLVVRPGILPTLPVLGATTVEHQ